MTTGKKETSRGLKIQTNKQIDDRQMNGQTNRETDRRMDGQTNRVTDSQANQLPNRKKETPTDGQKDRHKASMQIYPN